MPLGHPRGSTWLFKRVRPNRETAIAYMKKYSARSPWWHSLCHRNMRGSEPQASDSRVAGVNATDGPRKDSVVRDVIEYTQQDSFLKFWHLVRCRGRRPSQQRCFSSLSMSWEKARCVQNVSYPDFFFVGRFLCFCNDAGVACVLLSGS